MSHDKRVGRKSIRSRNSAHSNTSKTLTYSIEQAFDLFYQAKVAEGWGSPGVVYIEKVNLFERMGYCTLGQMVPLCNEIRSLKNSRPNRRRMQSHGSTAKGLRKLHIQHVI